MAQDKVPAGIGRNLVYANSASYFVALSHPLLSERDVCMNNKFSRKDGLKMMEILNEDNVLES